MWDPAFEAYLASLAASKPIVWCGDTNVAHAEQDIANAKSNRNKSPGFSDAERQNFGRLVGGLSAETAPSQFFASARAKLPLAEAVPGSSDGTAPYVDAWRFLHPLYEGTGVLGNWNGKEQGKGKGEEEGKEKANGKFEDPPAPYTYWSMRSGAYHKNVGWRLDYFVLSPELLPALRSSTSHRDMILHDSALLSDHCPVEIELEL